MRTRVFASIHIYHLYLYIYIYTIYIYIPSIFWGGSNFSGKLSYHLGKIRSREREKEQHILFICVWEREREIHTGWRRPIVCLISYITFRKLATNYRALLRKTTYTDKASYYSTPPCNISFEKKRNMCHLYYLYFSFSLSLKRILYTYMIWHFPLKLLPSQKSTKSGNSDLSVSRSTNSIWDFGLIWICTEEFEFLILVDFGGVAISVETVIYRW